MGTEFLEVGQAIEWLERHSGGVPRERTASPRPHGLDDAAQRNAARAKLIWEESLPLVDGDLTVHYLAGRAITTTAPSLRFHPALNFPGVGQHYPAMVAAVTHAATLEVRAVHCTLLDGSTAGKAAIEDPKRMLGPVSGASVHLGAAATDMAVSEGIENGLSVQQVTGMPTWAALSTSGLRNLQLPALPLAATVLIAADRDANDAGQRAANAAAERWTAEDRRVRIAFPPTKFADFNDALRAEASK